MLLQPAPTLQIPAPAVLGALTGVISSRLLRGEADSLPSLLEPLLDWGHRYTLNDGEQSC